MATNAGSPLPDSADCAPALACPNASTNLAANLTPGTIRRVHATRRSHFTVNYRVPCPGGVGRESLPRRSSLCACSHRIDRRARPQGRVEVAYRDALGYGSYNIARRDGAGDGAFSGRRAGRLAPAAAQEYRHATCHVALSEVQVGHSKGR